jgi:hypothetical protein
MRALLTAVIYFGSFLAIGLIAKMAARRWIDGSGTNLTDLRVKLAPRRKLKAFLWALGGEEYRASALVVVPHDYFDWTRACSFIGSKNLPRPPTRSVETQL